MKIGKLLFAIWVVCAMTGCTNISKSTSTGMETSTYVLSQTKIAQPSLRERESRISIFDEVRPIVGTSSLGPRKEFSYISRVVPRYPADLFKRGVSGKVTVGFVINAHGAVDSPYVVESTDPLFTAAILDAMKSWRYSPTMFGKHAVNTRTSVTIEFAFIDSTAKGSGLSQH